MTDPDPTEALLVEIRDLLRGYVKFARDNSEAAKEELARSMAQQERAIKNQEIALVTQRANAKLYRIVVTVATVVLIACVIAIGGR